TRRPFEPEDEAFMERFSAGWGTPDYVTRDEILGDLRAAGFSQMRFEDVSAQAAPTITRLHWLGGLSAPPARLLNKLGLMSTVRVRNAESCYMLRRLVDRGLGVYGLVTACK